jgi:hypothetical protein
MAVLILIGELSSNQFLSNLGGGAAVAAVTLEGMNTGLLAVDVGGVPLNSLIWPFFAIIVPALLISTIGYFFGLKGWHITRMLIPKNAEEIEQAKEKKRK